MFAPGVALRFEDITDGLANTIAMCEIATSRDRLLWGQFTREDSPQVTQSPATCFDYVDQYNASSYVINVRLDDLGRGGAFADGGAGWTLAQTILPPNGPSSAVDQSATSDGIFSAGSNHQSGCHVLMGDGAIVFLLNSIDVGDSHAATPMAASETYTETPYGLWGQLGTRAGQEEMDQDAMR